MVEADRAKMKLEGKKVPFKITHLKNEGKAIRCLAQLNSHQS